VAGEHGAAHGLLQAELEAHVEIAQPGAGLSQLVLDHLTDARALLHDDQRLAAQLLERHRLTGERVRRRDGEDDLVAEERLEGDAAMAPADADDAELELAVGDLRDDGLGVGHREPHAHVGVTFLELAEDDRHDAAARPGRRAELERTGDGVVVVRLELLEQLLLGLQQALCRGIQPQAGLGGLDPAARPVEQLTTEPLLERADLQRDGRLGDAEPLRGLREALPFDDGAECSQLTRVHKRSL
jgi:hypothetical protein